MDIYTHPDLNCAALVIIDTQNDFTLKGAPAEIPGTREVITNIKSLTEHFRNRNLPIVHVVRLYYSDGSNADLCRKNTIKYKKKYVVPGSKGAEIVTELKPNKNVKLNSELLLSGKMQEIAEKEYVMYKPRWGAFYQTPLYDFLQQTNINTVVICGCNFPNCPRATIFEASERDYKIVVCEDALSQISEIGIQELQSIGVNVQKTNQVVKSII